MNCKGMAFLLTPSTPCFFFRAVLPLADVRGPIGVPGTITILDEDSAGIRFEATKKSPSIHGNCPQYSALEGAFGLQRSVNHSSKHCTLLHITSQSQIPIHIYIMIHVHI